MTEHNEFTPCVLEGSEEFVRIALEQMDLWKELIGTKCQVYRVKEGSNYKAVLGAIYSDNLPDSQEINIGNYVVVINLTRMVKKWNETNEIVYFYDNKDYLKLGDVLVFSRAGRQYKYKITEIQTLGEVGNILNYYGITPYIQTQFTEKVTTKFQGNENIEED